MQHTKSLLTPNIEPIQEKEEYEGSSAEKKNTHRSNSFNDVHVSKLSLSSAGGSGSQSMRSANLTEEEDDAYD